MALGSTHPLTEMITRRISFAVVMKSGNLNFLEPSGPPQACNGTALPNIRLCGVLLYLIVSDDSVYLFYIRGLMS